jgi:molybdate transport system substrate-binding protein
MSPSQEMHVTAAGVYEHILHKLIPIFTREFGHSIQLSVANAGGVIKRLESSEPVDVVLTSAAGIAQLAATGLAQAASAVEIGRMRLGVAVQDGLAKPDLGNEAAVRAFLLATPKVAYIDPEGGGTAGPLIAKMFERIGVAAQVKQRGVLCKTGKDVARAVADGGATCGVTQASELIGASGLQFAGYIPTELQAVSVYSGAVVTRAKAADAARNFIQFLRRPDSVEHFRNAGWDAG